MGRSVLSRLSRLSKTSRQLRLSGPKGLGKARRKKKGVLPIVEADSVLYIFAFTPYVIQALCLPVKYIVEKQKPKRPTYFGIS